MGVYISFGIEQNLQPMPFGRYLNPLDDFGIEGVVQVGQHHHDKPVAQICGGLGARIGQRINGGAYLFHRGGAHLGRVIEHARNGGDGYACHGGHLRDGGFAALSFHAPSCLLSAQGLALRCEIAASWSIIA